MLAMIDLFDLKTIPYSTVFILGLAVLVTLLTTLVNRLLTKPEKSKAWRKEISEFQKELRAAQHEKDKKTTDKLMKKQQYIMQLQTKMMWQSMKVTLLFFVPLILMWQLLGGFYTTTTPVGLRPANIAYLPGIGPSFTVPLLNYPLYSLYWWYLLCSFLFSTTFSHLFGLIEVSD